MKSFVLLAAFLQSGAAPDAEPSSMPGPSIHQLELARHRSEPLRPRIVPDETTLRRGRMKAVDRVVYGYYPYWVHDLTTIRWSALTHLAWFAIELDGTGTITNAHGWPDAATVDAAHAAGVRVDLAFTLFSSADIGTLCGNPANRTRAAAAMVDRMVAGDADGIAVDFEGVPGAARDGFTSFIAELRAELTRRGLADAQISIAGPSVDWSSAFDLAALLDSADFYFIMGYDFFWSGSGHAGPSGILRITTDWRPFAAYSALRSVATWSSLVPADERRRIIYGIPYYGREWTTDSDAMGAATIASVGAVTYAEARDAVAAGRTRLWHEGIRNPWYVWNAAGAWHEVYYDDAESLLAKYRLARDEDLGGIGIWALNYDAPYPELWDLIESTFAGEPAPPAGHRLNPIPADPLPFHDERDTSAGPSQYFNFYDCAPDLAEYGREWVYRVDLCQAGTLEAHVPAYPTADPDLHLLTAPDQEACLARAHTDLSAHVEPGRYLLTVDTYVADSVELEGPYALDVAFTADPGTTPCAAGERCVAGTCVPEAADADADGDADVRDNGGDASDAPEDGGAESGDALPDGGDAAGDGCGCRAATRPGAAASFVLFLIVAALTERASGLRDSRCPRRTRGAAARRSAGRRTRAARRRGRSSRRSRS